MPLQLIGEKGSGPSASITVTTTAVAARLISIAWSGSNLVPGTEYHVFRIAGGKSTYIGETTSLSYDVPALPNTAYRVQIESINGDGWVDATTPASTLLPNVPYRVWGENMEVTSATASATQLTYATKLRNDEAYPIVGAASILAGVADPVTPIVKIGYRGSSWVVDSAIPAVPSGGGTLPGGHTPTPKLVITALKTLPGGVASNSTMGLSVLPGTTGYATTAPSIPQGGSTAGYQIHPSGETNTDRSVAGDAVGSDITGFPEYGPNFATHLVLQYGASSGVPASFCNCAVFGDSLPAQVRSPTINKSREGMIYSANHLLKTQGRKLRYISFGNGGAWSVDMLRRAEAVCPVIAAFTNGSLAQVALIQIPSANNPFLSAQEPIDRWAAFLATASAIRDATGIVCFPFIPTPPAAFSQQQSNIDGYAYIAARIAEYGGVNLAPSLGGTTMSATIAQDGAHLTQAGIDIAGPDLAAQGISLFQSIGADV